MEATPMETKSKPDVSDAAVRVREVPKWANRYAHNRTLQVMVNMSLYFLAFVAIAGSSKLAGREGQAGHKIAALGWCAVALAAAALWIWLVATHRLGRMSNAITGLLYSAEGTVVAAARAYRCSHANIVIAIVFPLCVALSVAACLALETAYRYWLPITAAYAVPFLVYVWARQGGMAAPFMLLWPGLLLIHAALALAGVYPFSSEPNALAVLTPTFGYGAVAALASHVYSRVALRRLRSLARGAETDGTGGQHA
jgi:hypothetical protein